MKIKVAKVAIENTAFSFDKLFDYSIPNHIECGEIKGCRVTVPFGAGNKKRIGIVFDVEEQESGSKLKSLLAVLDEAPLINNEMILLAQWMKELCFCPLYDCVKSMLPVGVNQKIIRSYTNVLTLSEGAYDSFSEEEKIVYDYLAKRNDYVKSENLLKNLKIDKSSLLPEQMAKKGYLHTIEDAVNKLGDAKIKLYRLKETDDKNSIKITKKQNEIITLLEELGSASVKEICYFTGLTPSVIYTLEKNEIIESFENTLTNAPERLQEIIEENIVLTDEQNVAYENLLRQYESGGGTSLLYGITGSGKTLVYMKMIDDMVRTGKDVIVMVPEIALTPQTLARFQRRYGEKVAVFHSGLSAGERKKEWFRVKEKQATIVVGTRSAVFAPLENIGLIIIDEEQEHTYKSEQSPRYNAKDVAKFRTKWSKALLVLASATPGIETYASAISGKYSLNTLSERYANAVLPEVETIDMCHHNAGGNTSILSSRLVDELKQNQERKKQSILLLNRRGYNTFVSCGSCGYVVRCPFCSISMTYHHANNRLMCHYCGYSDSFASDCPECGKTGIKYYGFGTQRVESELEQLIPGIRTVRMDADTTTTRNSHEEILRSFSQGEYDILLGTQMVAKGLDFENVTLVGVVSVDQMLYNDDFRSLERAFSLLTQVVGRAGRGKFKGKAVIQTVTPENEIINLAARQDYISFFNTEVKIRKLMVYPPYCDICLLGFVGTLETKVRAASRAALEMIEKLTETKYKDEKLIVLGPLPARVIKISNKFRYRLIIKCKNRSSFREMIKEVLIHFGKEKGFSDVTVFADINPQSSL